MRNTNNEVKETMLTPIDLNDLQKVLAEIPNQKTTPKKEILEETLKKIERKLAGLNNRYLIILKNKLISAGYESLNQVHQINIRESLILELAQIEITDNILDSYIIMSKASIIPDFQFDWLQNNLRTQIFLLHYLEIPRANIAFYDYMNVIFSYFDNTNNLEQKRATSLSNHLYTLNRVREWWEVVFNVENYSEWLNVEDDKQLQWTKNYIFNSQEVNLYSSDELAQKELRDYLLGVLDSFDSIPKNILEPYDYSSSKKKLFIDRMKRAWSQQKFRNAGKTKKPYHLPLTKQTKSRLETLSQVKGLSMNTMLDVLINKAYEIDCLDVDGNELY